MPTAGQVSSSLGCSISIGTTATTASSDTYTLLGETVTVPQFGLAYDSFGFVALADGFERIFKSTGKGGTIQVSLGRKASDTGQAAAQVALTSHLDYNFKVVLNDSSEGTGSSGTILYFKAKVLSYQTGPLQIGSVVMATIGLGINASSFSEVVAT
jgi:hypothetical protein